MYTFIANPNARSGRGILLWKQIEKILQEKKLNIKFLFTKYQHHATRLVQQILPPIAHPIRSLYWEAMVLLNEVIDGIVYLDKVTYSDIFRLDPAMTLPEALVFQRIFTVPWSRFLPQRITPP